MPPPRPAQPKVLIPTLISCLWPWFLVWSLLALAVLPLKLGDLEVAKWTSHPALGQVLRWGVNYFDAIWFLLAAVNVYLFAVRREGLKIARQWGMVIIPVVAVATWAGIRFGVPFGEFYYTSKLGLRIGMTPPVVAVLLWFTLIVCCRYAMLSLAPHAGRLAHAAGATGLLVLTDLLLEQVAWKVRFYWMWPSAAEVAPLFPPVQNFVAWAIIGFFLFSGMRGKAVKPDERFGRPVLVLVILNTVFLIARLANL